MLKTRECQLRGDRGFVFTDETGGPLDTNSLVHWFERLTAAAGVPRIRFHDLRHTCAKLLAEGEHPKIVQERLGHADIAMTLNLYGRVAPGMRRQAAGVLDAALDGTASYPGGPLGARRPFLRRGIRRFRVGSPAQLGGEARSGIGPARKWL